MGVQFRRIESLLEKLNDEVITEEKSSIGFCKIKALLKQVLRGWIFVGYNLHEGNVLSVYCWIRKHGNQSSATDDSGQVLIDRWYVWSVLVIMGLVVCEEWIELWFQVVVSILGWASVSYDWQLEEDSSF